VRANRREVYNRSQEEAVKILRNTKDELQENAENLYNEQRVNNEKGVQMCAHKKVQVLTFIRTF